jgi:hypothetical protein
MPVFTAASYYSKNLSPYLLWFVGISSKVDIHKSPAILFLAKLTLANGTQIYYEQLYASQLCIPSCLLQKQYD